MPVSLDAYSAAGRSVVALGTFDGVHRGHQALLCRAAAAAAALGADSLAFTFDRPPAVYLGRPKPLLLPPWVKYHLLETFVGRAVHSPFPQLAAMPPRTFVEQVLCRRLRAAAVVVGPDYRFGRDRAGDLAALRRWGRELGFDVHAVDAVALEGETISSTRIRTLLQAGQVREAAALLGRPPLLAGRVVRGAGVGRKLGYPTANLDTDPDCARPAQGIFAAEACLNGPQRAAVYLGTRPTFRTDGSVVEVHLLEGRFPELYGAGLHVHLVEKIREDAAFESAAALQAQIARDIKAVGAALAGRAPVACTLPGEPP